ncbi:hypothetical protein [Vampirovibrio sp.]|uniref:hypothetical protein n=1 Tax=Vampirovibrio sp. TaxID=2717857 RepID=UPI003594035B
MKKALIALSVALILLGLYQQSQIASLKQDYKMLNTDRLNLLSRVRALEAQNQQVLTTLEQMDSRVGYMDSKVKGVIDTNAQRPQHALERVNEPNQPADPVDPTQAPDSEEGGVLNTLRRIFR